MHMLLQKYKTEFIVYIYEQYFNLFVARYTQDNQKTADGFNLLENVSDVRLEDLTAMTVKFVVFWDLMLCSLENFYRCFEVNFSSTFRAEDGGNRFHRNVHKHVRDICVLSQERNLTNCPWSFRSYTQYFFISRPAPKEIILNLFQAKYFSYYVTLSVYHNNSRLKINSLYS